MFNLDRFMAKVAKSVSGCWLWTGATSKKRRSVYGSFSVDGRVCYPHRLAYEHFRGPIAKGMTIDHLCRNPLCVNPDHLEVVTCRENILRGTSPVARAARAAHCSNGHEFSERNTKNYNGQRICRTCHNKMAQMRTKRKRAEKAAQAIVASARKAGA